MRLPLIPVHSSLTSSFGCSFSFVSSQLSPKGLEEANRAARQLADGGFTFDVVHTSVLKRAIRTMWTVVDKLDLMWLPVQSSWRLNERHYGGLQGLDKAETAAKHGEEQVHQNYVTTSYRKIH